MHSFTSRSFWALAVLAGLSTANAAIVGESSQCLAEICGEPTYTVDGPLITRSMLEKPCPSATATIAHKEMTNAERLGRGLQLKPPVRRSRGHAARAQVSPIPQIVEDVTPVPITPVDDPVEAIEPDTYEGKIEVRKFDGSSLGYVSATGRSSGIFKQGATEVNALRVSVSLEAGTASGTGLAITMLNSEGPLFGLVQGRDNPTVDIATGSLAYLYLNGIELPGSEAGSVPMTQANSYSTATKLARAAESSIWNLDLTTGDLSAQWINSDGSAPLTSFWSQGSYIYAGADSAAFFGHYPTPITLLTLHFVPDL